MTKNKTTKKPTKKTSCCETMITGCKTNSGCGGCTYFLGFLGAAIYNISVATGFWMGVWGVIKALVWPVFLVFKLYKFLG